jgi:two-component sensor histidine kinase
MTDHVSGAGAEDLRSLIHRLNNQLGVILAHAELLEAKAPDEGQRARATQVVSAALQAMSLAHEIRTSMSDFD